MNSVRKIASLALLTVFAIGIASTVYAGFPISDAKLYLRTDRPSYLPGETGTLFVTVRNEGTSAFTVKNITVDYPWKSFIDGRWDGNVTKSSINSALASNGGVYNDQFSFTVPNDGRASSLFGGSASVRVGTDIGGGGGSFVPGSANVIIALPTYQPVGISTSLFPVVTIALLAIAVVLLSLLLVWIRRLAKK